MNNFLALMIVVISKELESDSCSDSNTNILPDKEFTVCVPSTFWFLYQQDFL